MASVWVRRDGERWRVCWREVVLDAEGLATRDAGGRLVTRTRSRSCSSRSSAAVLQGQIVQDLERSGHVEQLGAPVQAEAPAPTVAELAVAWLRWRHAQGAARGSLEAWRSSLERIRSTCVALGAESAGTWSPDVTSRALVRWRAEGLSEARLYEVTRLWLAVWVWAADQPSSWPGVAPAPRDRSLVLPRPPLRQHATLAPSWAELDAVIRACGSAEVRDLAVVLRCTGLRRAQVLAITVEDLQADELGQPCLRVTTGKGRRESRGRLVPLAGDAARATSRRASEVGSGLLWPAVRRQGGQEDRSAQGLTQTLRAAWERATEAEQVRRSTWCPTGHHKCRPAHAFRAGFSAGLAELGVADPVIEALLGHVGGSTLRRHYASLEHTTWPAQREAVRAIPPVDWGDLVPLEVLRG